MAKAKTKSSAKKIPAQVQRKALQTFDNPWVDRLARFGYVVRGVLYVIIGLLAVQVALGAGGKTTDPKGAIATVGAEPFGKFLLVLIAAGLAGYSLWGFIRGFLDPLCKGSDAKGLVQRLGFLVSGVSYGALVIPTVQSVIGRQSGGGQTGSPQDLSARLLGEPFGQALVGLLGLFWIGGAIGQFYLAYSKDFEKDFKSREMSADEKEWARRAARFGLAARGVVFGIVGWFLIQAALNSDPKRAKGLDGALQTLVQQPYGPLLLGVVALGLVCFGIYSLLCARWNRVL